MKTYEMFSISYIFYISYKNTFTLLTIKLPFTTNRSQVTISIFKEKLSKFQIQYSFSEN